MDNMEFIKECAERVERLKAERVLANKRINELEKEISHALDYENHLEAILKAEGVSGVADA
jgi:hypothetical protein